MHERSDRGAPPVPPPADAPPAAPPEWEGFRVTPRLVLGLFVIGLGVLLFLGQLGWEVGPLLRWWPAVLILIGALKVTQPYGRGVGAVLLVLGTALLLDSLDWVDLGDLLWPLAVIAGGALLVWGALFGPRRRPLAGGGGRHPDTLGATAVLGGVRRHVTSRGFTGGAATAVLGGVEIDLRDAEIAGGEAEIEVFVLWGGLQIAVPDHWRVDVRGTPVLGAFEDATRPRSGDAGPRLVIRGLVVMGAVEIKSEIRKSF